MNRNNHNVLGKAFGLVAACVGLLLSVAGCDLRVTSIGLVPPSSSRHGPEAVARLTASTYRFCPGNDITISWDGGTQLEGCDPGSSDLESCKIARMSTLPVGIAGFHGSAPEYLFGSVTLAFGPEVQWVQATYNVTTPSAHDRKTIVLDPVSPVHYITQEFEFQCDLASNTWQFLPGPLVPPEGQTVPDGQCMGITGMETTWHNISILRPDGSRTDMGTFQRNDTDLDGFQPSELEIEPTGNTISGIPWSSMIGQACSPGDPLPDSSWQFQQAERYLNVAYTMGCVPAESIYNPQARAECRLNHHPDTPICHVVAANPWTCTYTVDQGISVDGLAQPSPAGDDGIIPLCDLSLSLTCGNGACDPYCESGETCPADCTFSTQGGACYDSCDPDDPTSCLAGLSCLPRVAGGQEHICYNDVICNPDVTQQPNVTQDPGEQACVCGDGVCEQSRCSEFQQNCPADCGVSQPPPPPPAAVCGDGACNGGETCGSCSTDCGPC